MQKKYKGYTLEITHNEDDGNFVASFNGLSGEAKTLEEACKLCWSLIVENDDSEE